MIKAGDVFLAEYPPGSTKLHLCIAVCEEFGDPPTVVIVPINTNRGNADTTVVLMPGDHTSIEHESYVNYALAASMAVVYFQRKVVSHKEPLTAELLTRVVEGAETSKRTKNGVRQRLRELKDLKTD